MKKQIFPHIIVDPKVRFGKPIIEKTRVPVDVVVGKIAGGMSVDEVMKEYELTRQQVLAALKYATKLVEEEEVALR
ncbi:MAG: DUF433 domain-containing protein [Candidatus Levybacteria bacterium]|nr:DUF433 domain-containing protein [Candidatus Levybacteria bacterium]